jgi:hypothetical protein
MSFAAGLVTAATEKAPKIPCNWPRDMAQIPINVGDRSYAPLYPYGFGLSW